MGLGQDSIYGLLVALRAHFFRNADVGELYCWTVTLTATEHHE